MCGLVGVAGKMTSKQTDVFRTLLILDTIRGPHSTGVAAIDAYGDWDVLKRKGNAWDLFEHRDYTRTASSSKLALLGHNRYATKGKINNINAHPFEFENVVGVHNGTIRGQHRLIDHKDFEVDSENIFHSIEKVGLDDTLSVLDGAYALVYWDKRSEELVMLRNSERPLCYTFSEDNKTIYWASEGWMLSVALSRAGVKHGELIDVRPCNIYRFDIDNALTPQPIKTSIKGFKEFKPPLPKPKAAFPPFSNKGASSLKKPQSSTGTSVSSANQNAKLRELVGTDVEFEVSASQKSSVGQWYVEGLCKKHPEIEVRVFCKTDSDLWNQLMLGYDSVFIGNVMSYSIMNGQACFILKPATVLQIEDVEEDEDEDWGVYLGFNNRLLDEDEWERLTTPGCSWCSEVPSPKDAKDLLWVSQSAHVCKSCQELEEVKTYLEEA